MDQKEIDNIAEKIVVSIRSKHHDFWIDPEEHYNDHKAMREVVNSWNTSKGIFAKVFIGLMVVGSVTLALIGFKK